MGKLFAQYLAIYNDENLLNGVKSCQIRYKIFPNSKLTLKNLAKSVCLHLPKWPNFAKSGHTGPYADYVVNKTTKLFCTDQVDLKSNIFAQTSQTER